MIELIVGAPDKQSLDDEKQLSHYLYVRLTEILGCITSTVTDLRENSRYSSLA